jgi:[ribosomal protein S5]-alanine N-acetyltransferase
MSLRYLPITPELEFDCSNYEAVSQVMMDAIESTLALNATLPWSGYLAQTSDMDIVGICAFKGAPDENREVELAWFTFPGYERRGHGTSMARYLVGLATESGPGVRLIAITEAEAGPSSKICERVGFTCEGVVELPDDGPVWRWTK